MIESSDDVIGPESDGIAVQVDEANEYLDGPSGEGNRWNPYDHMDDYDIEDLNEIRFISGKERTRRKIKYRFCRVDWEEHVDMLIYTNQFQQRFRMEDWMFDDLLQELEDALTVSVRHSMSSTNGNEPIYPHIIIACGLRFLTGDSITSLSDLYGMSVASTRRIINMFLDAVDFNETCDDLQIKLPDPKNMAELNHLAGRWADVSTVYGLMNGHLAAMDGWAPRTEMPRNEPNQADYYSGHYQMYSLNIQAMCDPDLIFLYMSVAGPGKINDIRAFSRLKGLREWFDLLPDTFFASADNAYPLSRKILIPFSGSSSGIECNRTYNYYLSQLRIRIEMAFGLLTTKWRRLRMTLNFSVAKNAQIIRVCMKLHNFVIRKKMERGGGKIPRFEGDTVDPRKYGIDAIISDNPNQCSRFGFLETSNKDDDDIPVTPASSLFFTDCSRRSEMIADIKHRPIRRPQFNIDRND